MSLLDKASRPWALDEAAFLLCRFLLYCICRCLIFSHRQQITRTYLNKIFLSLLPERSHCQFPAKLPFQFFSLHFCIVHCPHSTTGARQFCLRFLSCLYTSVWASGFQAVVQRVSGCRKRRLPQFASIEFHGMSLGKA